MIPHRERCRKHWYLVDTAGGTWMTVQEIARAAGITEQAVYGRLHRPGMTPERLIEKPHKAVPPKPTHRRAADRSLVLNHPLNRMRLTREEVA